MARTSIRKRRADRGDSPSQSRVGTPSDVPTQTTDVDQPSGDERPAKKKRGSARENFEERFDVANRSTEEVLRAFSCSFILFLKD